MSKTPEAIQKALGERCRELRKRAGLSQLDIVRNFEMSLSHLQKIERGALDIRVSTAVKLAHCLGVPVSELFEGL